LIGLAFELLSETNTPTKSASSARMVAQRTFVRDAGIKLETAEHLGLRSAPPRRAVAHFEYQLTEKKARCA
jgi:hypothetical protein